MARKIIYTFLFLFVVFTVFVLIGYTAPDGYKGQIKEVFPDRRVTIWKNLTSVETIHLRKKDVESVDLLSNDINGIAWRENLGRGEFRLLNIIERDSPRRFVVEQIKASNGVTGTWIFELNEVGDKTEITITEDSENKNIWLRSYYTLMGRDILLRKELKSLRVSLLQRLLTTE